MRRFATLIVVLLVGVVCLQLTGCKMPPVPEDKKIQSNLDSPDAPKPSVDSDKLEDHNAVTEGEDDASKARRAKARASLGMK